MCKQHSRKACFIVLVSSILRMKKAILYLSVFIFMLAASACKKCYTCQQYCSYCKLKSNTNLVYKVCASATNTKSRVDSIQLSFPDSAYTCVKLTDNTDVCDNKSSIDEAYTYYLKQDYFCAEKTQ